MALQRTATNCAVHQRLTAPARREDALSRAHEHARKGRYGRAARACRTVLDGDPDDIHAALMLADCLVRDGLQARAIAEYRRVAALYRRRYEQQSALAIYFRILSLQPTDLDAHLAIAGLHLDLGRTAEGIARLEIVAETHARAARTVEAASVYERIVTVAPDAVSPRLRLADLRPHAAAEHLRAAAGLLRQQGQLSAFLQVSERLLACCPGDIVTMRALCRAYLDTGDTRNAVSRLGQLLRCAPSDIVGLELLAESFVRTGRSQAAAGVLGRLVDALQTMGPGATDEAKRVLDRGLDWDPGNTGLRRARGDLSVAQMLDLTELAEEIDVDLEDILEELAADDRMDGRADEIIELADSDVVFVGDPEGTGVTVVLPIGA